MLNRNNNKGLHRPTDYLVHLDIFLVKRPWRGNAGRGFPIRLPRFQGKNIFG